VETVAIQPEFKPGLFEAKAGVATPSGKAIRLVNENAQFVIRGVLVEAEPENTKVDVEADMKAGEKAGVKANVNRSGEK